MKKKKKKFNRYNVLSIITVAIFTTIGAKLYYLQIYKGQYYKDQAQTLNSAKLVTVAAPRGLITDENGIKLATEVLGYNLTYTSTTGTGKDNTQLFATLQKVFKILDDNKEVQTDNFPLKISPYRFEFNSSDSKVKQAMLLRFLKDRNFQDNILKVKFKGKKEEELSKSEKIVLDNELLKLTPEQIYNQLLVKYGVTIGIASLNIKATPDVIRRYLIVEDNVKMNFFSDNKSINIAINIKQNTSLIFEQILSELKGFKVENQPMREYPYGQLASSVLGYISKISSDDKAKYSAKGYDTNIDYVGTSGIEAAMESNLKGENGEKDLNDDLQAITKNTAHDKKAVPGKNVQLTLDANMQYATETTLNTEMKRIQSLGMVNGVDVSNATRGAAVAIDIHTGGVLALVSLPGYNPNDFSTSQGLTGAQSQKYFNPDYLKMANADGLSTLTDYMFPIDKSIKGNTTLRKDKFDYYPKYLYNYATMSLIPSGSTFKPMTAIAGLEAGVINANSTYNDIAGYDMAGTGKTSGPNWNSFATDGPRGVVNVVKALEVSSNPFFMNVGQKLREKFGADSLAKYAWMFGLGANPNSTNPGTGIEISENFGQVYNTVSQKTLSASQYLLSIELDLTNGVSSADGSKFPPIDLYDKDEDTSIVYEGKKLSEIKTQIKNYIKDSVRNGNFSQKNYVGLFKQLFAADPIYKGRKFTDANLNTIVNDINYQAVQTGHGSLGLPYNMFIASIGQGMDNFTPLQMANYIATLANGGTRYKVHLVDNIKDSNGKLISQTKPVVIDKANMSATTRSLVMQGMNNVTGAGGNTDGTASAALGDFPIPTGGKTGTAQFTKVEVQNKIGRGDYAWYVGYAPADNPKIAISVVLFDGGYGSDAAKVARGMYESYFKNDPRMKQYKNHYDIKLKRIN